MSSTSSLLEESVGSFYSNFLIWKGGKKKRRMYSMSFYFQTLRSPLDLDGTGQQAQKLLKKWARHPEMHVCNAMCFVAYKPHCKLGTASSARVNLFINTASVKLCWFLPVEIWDLWKFLLEIPVLLDLLYLSQHSIFLTFSRAIMKRKRGR